MHCVLAAPEGYGFDLIHGFLSCLYIVSEALSSDQRRFGAAVCGRLPDLSRYSNPAVIIDFQLRLS
jgi:hypothetical protein